MAVDTVQNKQRAARVLLVEDNPGDVTLTKLAFDEANIDCDLTSVPTGEEAIEILKKEGVYRAAKTPDLILLDLNLPGIHGLEVLEYIKKHDELKRIPVVVLSSSRDEADIVKSYDKYVNGYIVKPMNLDNFNDVVHKLEGFWFTLVVTPND